MNTRTRLFAALCALSLVSQAGAQTSPGAREVLERIERVGPTAAFSEIARREGEYGRILKNISSGQSDWLLVARSLAPAVDGFAATELVTSLSFALESEPRQTLRALDTDRSSIVSIPDVCSAGAVAVFDEEGIKRKQWAERVRRKLKTVQDGELLRKKAICTINLPR